MSFADFAYHDRDRSAGAPYESPHFNTSMFDASNLLRGVFENFAQSGAYASMNGMPGQNFAPYAGSSPLDFMPMAGGGYGQNGLGNIAQMFLANAGPLLSRLGARHGLGSFLAPFLDQQEEDVADYEDDVTQQDEPAQAYQPSYPRQAEAAPYYAPSNARQGEPAPYYPANYAPQGEPAPYIPNIRTAYTSPAIDRPPANVPSYEDDVYAQPYAIPRGYAPEQQARPYQRQDIPAQRPAPPPVESADAAQAHHNLAELRSLSRQYDFGKYLPISRERAMKFMMIMPQDKKRLFTDLFNNVSRDGGRTLTRADLDAYSMRYEGRRFFETA